MRRTSPFWPAALFVALLGACGSDASSKSDGGAADARGDATTTDLAVAGSHDGAVGPETLVSPDATADGTPDGPLPISSDGPAPVADVGIDGNPATDAEADAGSGHDGSDGAQSASIDGNLDGPSSNPDLALDLGGLKPDVGASEGPSDSFIPGDAGSQTPGKIGIIALTQTVQTLPAPVGTIVASGAVAQFGFHAGSDTCTSTTVGDCQRFNCSSGTSTPQSLVQAGNVTITGLAHDVSLTFMPAQSGYMSSAYGSALWTSSTPATVVVTGSADVPAFSMSIVAPNPIVVTTPLVGAGSTYSLSRAGDLAVKWTGGVEGSVTVSLTSSNAPGGSVTISCAVDAAKGQITVPATFMSGLGTSGSFSAGVTTAATKTVNDWLMEFQASTMKDQGTVTFTN
jgi:hypothetical protein